MNSVLSVHELSVELEADGRRFSAVKGINLDIAEGEAVALVGESGSGKSVTALSILRLLPSTARVTGSVRFRDEELLDMGPRDLNRIRGHKIAMVYQEPMSSLNPALTIGDQLAETIRYHLGLGKKAAEDRAVELLDLVRIPEPRRRLGDYPHMFSGGMVQRVMIAMALSCGPELLLADEPTTALDATVQAQILALLSELRAKLKMALLFLTHDLGAVASIADRVDVMYCGELVESSPSSQLFDRPLHPYTAGLLGSIVALDRPRPPSWIPGRVPPPWQLPAGCRFHPRCAHAQERCAAAPVELRAVDGRSVRCVRAEELRLVGTA